MEFRPIKTPISEIFSIHGVHYAENSAGELILEKCYNCGRGKKMYVQAETGLFKCHRCDEKGGPVKLISSLLGCSFGEASELVFGKKEAQSIRFTEEDSDLEVSITGRKKTKYKSGNKVVLPAPMKLPHYMKPLKKSDLDAWNYLKKRGLTDEIIEELQLYHWESSKRIVLPVTIDGEIYGTLSRDYIGDQERKVLNSQGNWRSFSVWNYDLARESEELIVCEGAFSAIKCGIFRSVALLGKVATDGQVEIIKSTRAKKLYICLDIGTDTEQQNLYRSFAIYFPGRVYKIELPPVISLGKKTVMDLDLLDWFNKQFKTEMKYIKESHQLYFTYEDRQQVFKIANIRGALSSDEKKELLTKFLEGRKLKEEDKVNFILWLMFRSEYKDSGDYNFEEMDEFIRQAKPFKGGPTSW